jgi:hypothetical protein
MRDNHSGKGLITTEKMGCGNETAQMAISSYLDGEATGLEKTLAEWHLAECRECNRMLNRWSLNAGLLRQSARDPEMDRLAAAIAGQTRQWLWNDLLAAPTVAAPAPLQLARLSPASASARFRPLKSSFVAAMMVVITILGISLGTLLSGPNFQSTPAVATIDREEFPAPASPAVLEKATTNSNPNSNSNPRSNTNPRPGSLLATVTPAAPQPSLAMLYSAASQTMAPQQIIGGTPPLLGYATPYTAFTPGVGRSDSGKGN